MLAKSDCIKSDILLHKPKHLAYGSFLLCQNLLCVRGSVLENTLERFLSMTAKTIRLRKELPTRRVTLRLVVPWASPSASSLAIQTGRERPDFQFTFW